MSSRDGIYRLIKLPASLILLKYESTHKLFDKIASTTLSCMFG